MRKAPLLPVAVALAAGIGTALWVPTVGGGTWLALWAVAAVAVGLLLLLFRPWRQNVTLVALLFFVFFLGGVLGHSADPRNDVRQWSRHCPQPAWLELKLVETPCQRGRTLAARAEVERVDSTSTRGELMLFLRPDSVAHTLVLGDRLLVHGYADSIRKSLYATADHYLLVAHGDGGLREISDRLRRRLLLRMREGPLAARQRGVAEALVLGWKGDLEPDLKQSFRDAGLVHLLCVSGLHVGLLMGIVGGLMWWTGRTVRGRRWRGVVQLVALWAFALLTGLAPATTRAAVMFSLLVTGDMLSRRTDSLNLLAVAAIGMLVADPLLITDLAFGLSFSAVAGILLVRPVLRELPGGIARMAAVSLAATLATLPLVAYHFHRLPVYFLVSNVVVLPFAAPLLALALLYVAVPCTLTAVPLEWLLRGVEWVTTGVAHLPGAILGLPPVSVWVAVSAAAVIFYSLHAINRPLLRYFGTKDLLSC